MGDELGGPPPSTFPPTVSEFDSNGARDFKLTFAGALPYRVVPVTGASPSITALRAGMNAMAAQPAEAHMEPSAGGQGTALDEKAALVIPAAPRR
jgi:hypothetical protein